MKIYKVESSAISEIGYDCNEKLLIIEFKNGQRWQYENVPADLCSQLLNAESIGSTFHAEIRNNNKYPATKIRG